MADEVVLAAADVAAAREFAEATADETYARFEGSRADRAVHVQRIFVGKVGEIALRDVVRRAGREPAGLDGLFERLTRAESFGQTDFTVPVAGGRTLHGDVKTVWREGAQALLVPVSQATRQPKDVYASVRVWGPGLERPGEAVHGALAGWAWNERLMRGIPQQGPEGIASYRMERGELEPPDALLAQLPMAGEARPEPQAEAGPPSLDERIAHATRRLTGAGDPAEYGWWSESAYERDVWDAAREAGGGGELPIAAADMVVAAKEGARERANARYVEARMAAADSDPVLAGLHPAQQRAVLCREDAQAMLAGAGTGKTHTIVAKVEDALVRGEADPRRTALITFTNKAADEIRERVARETGSLSTGLFVGTIHSLALELLGRGRPEGRVELDETDPLQARDAEPEAQRAARDRRYALMERLVDGALDDDPGLGSALGALAGRVVYTPGPRRYLVQVASRWVAERDGEWPGAEPPGAAPIDRLGRAVMERYEAHLEAQGTTTVGRAIRDATAGIESGAIAPGLQSIVVDEWQDVNGTQRRFVEACAAAGAGDGTRTAVCIAGDDWQSIYGFQGGGPEHTQGFLDDHPGCVRTDLVQTWRFGERRAQGSRSWALAGGNAIPREVAGHPGMDGAEPAVGLLGRTREAATARDENDDAVCTMLRALGRRPGAGDRPARVLVLGRTHDRIADRGRSLDEVIDEVLAEWDADPRRIGGKVDASTPEGAREGARQKALWKVAQGLDHARIRAAAEEAGVSVDLETRTVHRAKGLEADHVIYVAPDDRADVDQEQAQEERRCWYVAMTRAKESMVVLEPPGGASRSALWADLEADPCGRYGTAEVDPGTGEVRERAPREPERQPPGVEAMDPAKVAQRQARTLAQLDLAVDAWRRGRGGAGPQALREAAGVVHRAARWAVGTAAAYRGHGDVLNGAGSLEEAAEGLGQPGGGPRAMEPHEGAGAGKVHALAVAADALQSARPEAVERTAGRALAMLAEVVGAEHGALRDTCAATPQAGAVRGEEQRLEESMAGLADDGMECLRSAGSRWLRSQGTARPPEAPRADERRRTGRAIER